MSSTVNNIYCVGRNYAQHAHELNNAVPSSPFLFTKPTHALVEAKGQEIIMPGHRGGGIHYEAEFVVHISRQYEPGLTVNDLVDKMALGIDLTLRDVQNELKKKGYPWLLAKGIPNSAVLTPWQPFRGIEEASAKEFALEKNGVEVQHGNIKEMIFDLPTIIKFVAEHFGLAQGDILFTGTPAGVGPVENGDHLALKWDNKLLGDCVIKFTK